MKWTREPPDPPELEPPDYYWFKYDGEKYPCVVEVWPSRKYWPNGLWGEKISAPIERVEEEKNG